jgi:hypothetical protein
MTLDIFTATIVLSHHLLSKAPCQEINLLTVWWNVGSIDINVVLHPEDRKIKDVLI